MRIRAVLLSMVILGALILAPVSAQEQDPQMLALSACGLPAAAFCDPFDAPSPNGAGTRSGDLDGVVWGVSRATSSDNPSQGDRYHWSGSTMNRCGTNVAVNTPRDVQICNGLLVESVNDGGGQTNLAMYPRQPFDIAGRTGKVAFDVSADSQGPHAAWPAFVYTDQPVPAPYGSASALFDNARNSFGFGVATSNCNGDPNLTGVDQMWTTTNYQYAQRSFSTVGCIHRGTQSLLNHFEVRISASQVEVWATDPGQANLHQLAVGMFAVPLTRGLLWMEDVHYNACKFDSQCNHTFTWDNFGFDGPVLSRDLGFDVLDAISGGNIGFLIPSNGKLTIQIPNVQPMANAASALLEFNLWPHQADTLTYAINGHAAHTQPWPFGPNGQVFGSQTIAMSVPLNEIQAGTNTVVLTSTDTQLGGLSIANIDLILIPDRSGTPVPTSTPSPMPAATDSPTPTATVAPTDTPLPTDTPEPTATTVPGDTPMPTDTPTLIPIATVVIPITCEYRVQVRINGVERPEGAYVPC